MFTLLFNVASLALAVGFLVWLIVHKRQNTPVERPTLPNLAIAAPPLDVSLQTLEKRQATIGRGPYLLYGAALMALKYNLDRAIAAFIFDRSWALPDYFSLLNGAQPLQEGRSFPIGLSEAFKLPVLSDSAFYLTLGLVSLAFLWIGIVLTIRRLRDLTLSPYWSLLFFVPFINLLLFLLLSILPTPRTPNESKEAHLSNLRWLDAIIPDHGAGSAAMGVLIPFLLGLVGLAGATTLGTYGWGIFLGLPFCVGLFSVLVYGYHRPRLLGQCLAVSAIAVGILGAAVLALAFEGVICILMASPLAALLALMGGAVGYAIQARPVRAKKDTLMLLLALALSWPLFTGAESRLSSKPPVYAVESIMEIDAPPETVWNNVVTFSQLPEPTEWVFHTGIAYPIRAEIHGRGVGAVRHCIFSTGEFVEPIEIWDEPRQLGFGVKTMPMPMHEWSYKEIHPPHLDQYLQVTHGEFRLQRLPGDRTRLLGTTWYSNKVWPSLYWKTWSDGIIHTIHLRVLQHIKNLSEAA